jgi:CubicO group peptidase (beta-lactamase class C family)
MALNFKTKDVDAIFANMDKTDCPGCSMAIIHDGQIVYSRGYGMANLAYGVPNRANTAFNIASNTKQFTTMCVAMCLEEGLCDLKDDVRKYFPELPDHGKTITLADFIYHTSGMRDYPGLFLLAGYYPEDHVTKEQLFDMIVRQKELNYEPGSQFSYTNAGYSLLTHLVGRLTGTPYIQFVEEKIFKPLGMKNTFLVEDHHKIIPNYATGYIKKGDTYESTAMYWENVGDTNIVTTVEDLLLWDQNFYHNILGKGGQSLIDQMHVTGKLSNGEALNYAFGLMISKYRGLNMVNHGGGTMGFLSQMGRFPDQKTSIIILCNQMDIAPDPLVLKVADVVLADQFTESATTTQASSAEGQKMPLEALQKIAGHYTTQNGNLGTIQFILENETLYFNQGEKRINFVCTAPYHFLSEGDMPVEICFEVDGNGKPVKGSLDVMKGLIKDTLLPFVPAQPTPQELAEFEGRFYCPDNEAWHTLKVVDDRLKLFLRSKPLHELKPTQKDTFEFDGTSVAFQRDPQGKVYRYEITAGRIRNLFFTRQ